MQREVGVDTDDWDIALKTPCRPQTLFYLVRSETVRPWNLVLFAETGHLALATLHANNANQASTGSSTFSQKNESNSC